MINLISSLFIPLMVLVVILYGLYKKVDIYDVFVEGAKDSFDMITKIFPCILGMLLAVNILLNSGLIDYFFNLLRPILFFPVEVLPMMFLRPVSGTTTLAILNDLLANYGPDSFIGRLASVIQGATDTTLYVLTLYFGSIGIKKIRYSLWVGLAADVAGIMAAIFLVTLFFGN